MTTEIISTGPCLIVTQPEQWRGHQFALRPQVGVGRDPGCDVHLGDPTVSRYHAEIGIRPDGQRYVCDLNSSNGTYVNGMRLEPAGRSLRSGDLIRFGELEVRFQDPLSPETGPSPVATPEETPGRVELNFDRVRAGRNIDIAGRDVHKEYNYAYYQQVLQERASFAREVAAVKTRSRRLIILGLVMFVAGGGVYTYAILRFIARVNSEVSSEDSSTSGPSLLGPSVHGVPIGIIGFAVAGIGLVIFVIGLIMHIVAVSRRKALERTAPPPPGPAFPGTAWPR